MSGRSDKWPLPGGQTKNIVGYLGHAGFHHLNALCFRRKWLPTAFRGGWKLKNCLLHHVYSTLETVDLPNEIFFIWLEYECGRRVFSDNDSGIPEAIVD